MTDGGDAREEILGRVRRALGSADRSPVTVPRSYRTTQRGSAGDPVAMVELFAQRVADYRAVVVRCAVDEVPSRVAEALADCGRVLVPAGLPWHLPGAVEDDALSNADLDAVDAVVTTATVGIAATGTIVLSHGAGQGRRALTLVPDVHVCVVRADQVVPDVPDAVVLLDPDRPTTWISGPSATSDIELDRVEGVHGPRTLHVILAG